jgi:hypothetical protein
MSWKDVVKSVAPTIGAALGGPMAGAAVKVIAQQFLGDENATEQDISEALTSATPDQLIQLKQIEKDFEAKMSALNVDVFKLEVQDRDSARKNNKDSIMPAVLVVMLTLMVGAGVTALIVFEVPEANSDILYMLYGQVVAAWVSSVAYWVGTTRSSSDKNKMLNFKS